MRDDLRQELTGWGKVVWGDKSYNKIYYKADRGYSNTKLFLS